MGAEDPWSSFVCASVVPRFWNHVRAVPIGVMFSQHEAFGKNCLDRAMACEYAFKGTNPSGIALKYCVRWREPESLQSRSYCLLGMAMGMCQPLMGTRKCLVRCQCAMKQRGWWGTTGPVWASPASFANIDTSGEVMREVAVKYKQRPFFTHRRDDQSLIIPNNMFRWILTAQKGFASLFPVKQLCLQGINRKKVALERWWSLFHLMCIFNDKMIYIELYTVFLQQGKSS